MRLNRIWLALNCRAALCLLPQDRFPKQAALESVQRSVAKISSFGTNRKVWEEHLSQNHYAGEGLLGLLVCACSYRFSSVAAAAHLIPLEILVTPWCDLLRHRAMTVVTCQAAGVVLKELFASPM